MEKIYVDVYLDTTPYYENPDFDDGDTNCIGLWFPKHIVTEWYDMHKEEFIAETMHDLRISMEECTFDKWINEVYLNDDMDGLYDYCVDRGYDPELA